MSIESPTANGTNKYALLQSQSQDILDIYNEIFSKVEGSLTTVSDNDCVSKFNIALTSLNPTLDQTNFLNCFKKAFKNLETTLEPGRLNFTISKAMDDEICINRLSENGVSKIILHEGGVVAFSFIALKGVIKDDILDFYEDNVDCETITYKFFAL